jgi:hypothetical protein
MRGPYLTRGWVCSIELLGIASAVFLGSESHGTHGHILLFPFLRLHQLLGQSSSIRADQQETPSCQGIMLLRHIYGNAPALEGFVAYQQVHATLYFLHTVMTSLF